MSYLGKMAYVISGFSTIVELDIVPSFREVAIVERSSVNLKPFFLKLVDNPRRCKWEPLIVRKFLEKLVSYHAFCPVSVDSVFVNNPQ